MQQSQRHTPRRRGSIEKRGPSCYLVRLTLATNSTERRQFRTGKVIHGKKSDAERYLTEQLAKLDSGAMMPTDPALRRQTLGQWLDEYFATWSNDLAARTKERCKESMRLYLPDRLRAVRLTALSPTMLQDLFNEMSEKVSWPTVSFAHRFLRARLNDAIAHDRLAKNPMKQVQLKPRPHTEPKTLTEEQASLFLSAAAEDRFGALWSLLLLTALRPGEALGLKWPDWQEKTLAVRRALVRTRTSEGIKWSLEDTKTDRERLIALPDAAVRVLTEHKRRQAAEKLACGPLYGDHQLIFATRLGTPLNLNTEVPRHFKRVLKSAGLPALRLYDLRHTVATLLLADGENPKVVQELLGHASITLTLGTYAHVLPHMQRKAADRLNEMLTAKTPRLVAN